jgi:SAM-dependent methyltransferase
MNKDYYKEYYHLERKNWWFTVRSKILADRIATLMPKKPTNQNENQVENQILNIGVATGATSEMLSNFGQVMSVEYDTDCYQFTKTILKTPILQGSILDLPFEKNSYDLVCAFDVIEHVEDDQKAVDEMIRVCKSGSYVIVTVPAFMSLWGQHDVINQHFRRYTLPEIENLFAKYQNEGTILYKTYFNSLLFPPIFVARNLLRLVPRKSEKNRQNAGSDHSLIEEKSPILKVLETIFEVERKMLRKNWHFPLGVSAMLVWQKK